MRSGDFGSDGQHDAFGEAFRPRTPRRDLDHLDTRTGDTRIGQHRVERGRELPGPIADEEPEPPDVLAEVHHELADVGADDPVTSRELRKALPSACRRWPLTRVAG
jgi:hypothetical protein